MKRSSAEEVSASLRILARELDIPSPSGDLYITLAEARKFPLPVVTFAQPDPAGEETPSPWGEGRGEGKRVPIRSIFNCLAELRKGFRQERVRACPVLDT